ncbi:MAG: hypothetical protein K8F91_25465 [Candidatus Obscuribacterales bacterium]|nr:hypothetical protein [Candidatus Obscuribacterales bacterium]
MNGTWGMGNIPSAQRSYLTGYIARDSKRWELALRAFKEVIDGLTMRDAQVDQAYAEVLAEL